MRILYFTALSKAGCAARTAASAPVPDGPAARPGDESPSAAAKSEPPAVRRNEAALRWFSLRRMLSYTRLEALQLQRDPIRATLAVVGSLILMFVIGYGINLDVEELTFAVLDRDQTLLSQGYVLDLEGSRYFRAAPPIASYAEMDARMRTGELALAIEIPSGFARDAARGDPVAIGAWIDGANPSRANTVSGYVQGIHADWIARQARMMGVDPSTFDLLTRFRYNPDMKSLVAMAPAIMPLLLLMIPAILTALSVVREKELGSIINFYVTPVTRLEFLIGKQLPYVGLAFVNFLMLVAFALLVFRVPFTGSFPALAGAALLYVFASTAIGLLISSFISSQVAALFATALLTLIPGVQFSGLTDPVSSLQGLGRAIGTVYPSTYFITAARGAFSKGLGFGDFRTEYVALALAGPVILGAAALLLRKQAT